MRTRSDIATASGCFLCDRRERLRESLCRYHRLKEIGFLAETARGRESGGQAEACAPPPPVLFLTG